MRFGESARGVVIAGVALCVLAACTATHDTAGSGSAGLPSIGSSTNSGSSQNAGSSQNTSGTPGGVTTSSSPVALGSPSASKQVSAYCTTLQAAGVRIEKAQSQLYTPGPGQAGALDTLESELDALKVGAPSSIQTAIADIASAFRQAQTLLTHPSGSTGAALAQISSKLASDTKAISGYVASEC